MQDEYRISFQKEIRGKKYSVSQCYLKGILDSMNEIERKKVLDTFKAKDIPYFEQNNVMAKLLDEWLSQQSQQVFFDLI
jgi:hypothetical protein